MKNPNEWYNDGNKHVENYKGIDIFYHKYLDAYRIVVDGVYSACFLATIAAARHTIDTFTRRTKRKI